MIAKRTLSRGATVADVRRFLLALPDIAEGRSYGMPAFLLNGRFFARFRDAETVLVVQLSTIDERDVLLELDPRAFFFTDHYKNHPAVLVRLAEAPMGLLQDVLQRSWKHVSALPPVRVRQKIRKTRGKRA
jgi:hypothetical protein